MKLKILKKSEKNKETTVGGGDSTEENFEIDPKELTGSAGLKRTMNYIDSITPSFKGDYSYNIDSEHIFKPENIGKYSSKIKNICDSIYNRKKITSVFFLISIFLLTFKFHFLW